MRPIFMYGCERWTMSENMEEALRVWERRILRKVYDLKGTEIDGVFVQTRNYKINIEVLI
jgi:hypothetical protein